MATFSRMALSFLLLGLESICFSQSMGLLTGTITDPSVAAIAGAQVKCRNTETDLRMTAETNQEGLFRFPDLPVGSYELDISRDGFETLLRRGITLYTGQTLDLSMALKVGQVSQSVEVTSPVPLVQTTTSDLKSTVDSRQMMDLPLNGRNTFDLAVLTPGSVNTDAGTVPGQADNTGLAVNGLSTVSNNWSVDGSTYKNRSYGSAPTLPNPDTLQEFTVQTSTFSADTQGGGAFTTNAIGTYGDAGRNDLRRPGLINTNASLFRHFTISERLQLEFRAEAFNALNHPNLNLFYSAGSYISTETVTSPTFGQITYAQDPRLMQLALKLRF